MKDNKKFFYNNRLNKGYSKIYNNHQTDLNIGRKKYQSMLPPIDMIEEYEELYPGTLDKLFDMTQKEQNHRHSLNLLEIKNHAKATALGRICALVFISIVVISSLILALLGFIVLSALLISTSFISITIISYFYSNKQQKYNKFQKFTNKAHSQVKKTSKNKPQN